MPTITPTPPPTATPTPTATPAPSVADYYVILRSKPYNTIGSVQFCVNYPDYPNGYKICGLYVDFNDKDLFLDYLLKEGTITDWQHRAHYQGNEVKVYLNDIAPAIQNLAQRKGYRWMEDELGFNQFAIDNRFLHHYDKSPSALDDGFVVIQDGRLVTMKTNADGETVRVELDSVDTEDFLDYLYSIGRITAEQRNYYDLSKEMIVSFADAADALDFFDWTDAANDGISIDALGIDETDVDYIRRELLPLFQFGD